MSSPTVRSAREDDTPFLGWAILAATRSHLPRGWFDISLGLDDAGCLEFTRRLARTETRSWWHYANFLIAEVQGVPAAALCAFRAGDGYPLSQAAIAEVAATLGWGEAEIGAMWARSAYLFTCTVDTDDDVWALENMATRVEHRGHGLATALVDRALDMGRGRGFKQAQLSLFIGSLAARRAYERAGFRLAEEKRSAEFERACGVPGLWCLRRPL